MKKFFTGVLLSLSLLVAGKANAQTKIGYISSQELISVMPESKKDDSMLQDFLNALIQTATE
jgi:outer membrane protein